MTKKLSIFSLAVFTYILLAGSLAHAQMTQEELSMQRLQDKINMLEKSMATMQQELYRSGKSTTQKLNDQPAGNDDERTRAMNGKFEEMQHNISTLAAKLDKIIADIDFRLAALEKTVSANAALAAKPVDNSNPIDMASAVNPEAGQETPPAAPAKTDDKKPAQGDATGQYDKAVELVRLSKYDEAERALKDFIANNKGNALLSNAYYWLGESYFSRQNYQQAAITFLKGYQDYPKGNKAPDNLLKLAISMKSLKKEKEACATLDKMKREYPAMDKDLLAKSTAERKTIKCQ